MIVVARETALPNVGSLSTDSISPFLPFSVTLLSIQLALTLSYKTI